MSITQISAEEAQSILRAVDDQRMKLIGVLGVVQCMEGAFRIGEPPAEFDSALDLLGDEVQRIVSALEAPALRKAAAAAPGDGQAGEGHQ